MFDTLFSLSLLDFFGLVTGALAVGLLIRQNIWTWPVGIAYILASLYIFYQASLYANFALHLFLLGMSVYGWYYWLQGGERGESTLAVSRENRRSLLVLLGVCAIAIFASGSLFSAYTDADLPWWDNTVSCLSVLAMWLQSRKKIESWMLWFVIDVISIGIYFYKGIYFYSLLYFIYLGMAALGYTAWRKSLARAGAESDGSPGTDRP